MERSLLYLRHFTLHFSELKECIERLIDHGYYIVMERYDVIAYLPEAV